MTLITRFPWQFRKPEYFLSQSNIVKNSNALIFFTPTQIRNYFRVVIKCKVVFKFTFLINSPIENNDNEVKRSMMVKKWHKAIKYFDGNLTTNPILTFLILGHIWYFIFAEEVWGLDKTIKRTIWNSFVIWCIVSGHYILNHFAWHL